DSERLWKASLHETLLELDIDTATAPIPIDPVGLRVDEIIAAYYHTYPWKKKTLADITQTIVELTIAKIQQYATLMPGVIEALELCKRHNCQLGLASSSPVNVIQHVIQQFALKDYFTVIESGDQLVYAKPHPEIY